MEKIFNQETGKTNWIITKWHQKIAMIFGYISLIWFIIWFIFGFIFTLLAIII